MPETQNKAATVAKRSNQRTLIFLILLFGLHYLASFTFFFHPEWLPKKTLNHGDLITPVRPVAAFTKTLQPANSESTAVFLGHWSVLGIGGRECGDACRQNLYKMRQVRRALGVDRRRVKRYYLVPGDWHRDQYEAMLPEYRGTEVLIYDETSRQQLQPFQLEERSPEDQVYIIDPKGNLMMHYAPDADPKGLLKDLQQLLKASQIG